LHGSLSASEFTRAKNETRGRREEGADIYFSCKGQAARRSFENREKISDVYNDTIANLNML
jgi:hypothetical protein